MADIPGLSQWTRKNFGVAAKAFSSLLSAAELTSEAASSNSGRASRQHLHAEMKNMTTGKYGGASSPLPFTAATCSCQRPAVSSTTALGLLLGGPPSAAPSPVAGPGAGGSGAAARASRRTYYYYYYYYYYY